MAKNEAKIKFTAETGDFNNTIKKSNESMSQLRAELKLNETQMKGTGTSVEGLTKKQEILTAQLKASEDKTEALREKVKKAAEIYGENSSEVTKLKTQLANAENAEEQIRQAINSCNDELDKHKKGFDDAEKSSGKFGETLGKIGGAVAKTAVAGIAAVTTGAVAGAKALTDMSKSGAEFADNILTESTVTGIATDKLQEYQYAAELVDVSTETLTNSMAKNIKSMKSVQDGSKSMSEAYKKLGVSATDSNGNLRDGETVYWELIDSLGKIENETERDALAMQVLGKSAQELNPLIEAGAGKMQELGQQARDAGYVMGDEALNAFGAFDDQMQYLNVGAEAAKNALGSVLLPVLTDLSGEGVNLLGNFTNAVLNANGDMGKIGEAVGTLVTDGISVISNALPQVVNMAVELVTSIVNSVVQALPSLISGILKCLPSLIQGFVTLFNSLVSALPQIVEVLVSALPTLIPLIIDALVTMIVSLCTMIPQIIQPIIDNLPDIIISIVDAIVTNLPLLIEGVIQLTLGIVSALPQIIQALVDAIPTVVEMVVTSILENLPMLIKGFIDLFVGVAQATDQIFASLNEVFPAVFKGIWEAIKNVFAPVVDWFGEKWNAVKEKVATVVTGMKDKVLGIFDNIKSKISTVVNNIKTTVTNTFNNVKEAMQKPIESAKEKIKSIIDTIKGFFTGLKLKFPNISLPHFTISPKGWKIGDLLKGEIPKLSIAWHADGAIFTKPTLIGTGNSVHGVGEAGAEAVLPIDKLEGYIENAIEKTQQVVNFDNLANAIERLADRAIEFRINDRVIAEATASATDNVHGLRNTFRSRGLILE